MEKFEVYNRELNTWQDENIAEISGWDENWVQDKTTDNAKVKLKYKGLTTPNWDIGHWCRLLHINEKQQNAHLIESESLDAVVENETITIEVDNIEDYNENDYIIDLNGNLGLITSVLSDSIEVKRYFVNGLPIVQSENGATYKKQALVHTNYIDIADYVDVYSEAGEPGRKNWYIRLNRAFDKNLQFTVGTNNIVFYAGETGSKFIIDLIESAERKLDKISPHYFITENIIEYQLRVNSIAHIKYNEDKTGVIIYLEKPLTENVEIGYSYYTSIGGVPVLRTATEQFNVGEIRKEIAIQGIYDDDSYMPDITNATTPETINYIDYIYIPQNHEQYVIEDINKVEDILNDEWDIQLELGEPINISQGIICETKSHTNQIEKTVDVEGSNVVYKHRAKTHYSVLSDTLKLVPSNNDEYYFDNMNYSRFDNSAWFNRIKINNSNFLDNIPFNDETYNEPTLYNILLDKFDSSTGRTPVMYFDIDGKNDLPYNIERTEYVLNFERQDGLDKEELQLNNLMEGRKESIESKSIRNFANGIVSNFDNLAPNTTSNFVSKTLFALPEIDSNERNIGQYNDANSNIGIWVLKLPHLLKKVNSVKKIEIKIDDGVIVRVEVEKTKFDLKVLEQKQYNASSPSDFEQRKNLCWYKEGENIIHLNDYYYKEDLIINKGYVSIYQVEYEPLISGRIDQNKDYEVIVNQVDSQIDSEKFGKYLMNYLNSMNKFDLTISKTVENFEDIAEIGSRVIDGDKVYLITNIGIQNRGFDYDIVYQLNENHFRKNDSIVAPQEIRKNIEIGIDATKERKSVFPVKYSLGFEKQNNISNKYFTDRKMLFSSLLSNYQDKEKNYPQIAYFKFKSKLLPNGAIENQEIERLCELSRYNLGNSICFNMRYIDNAEAGKSKPLQEKGPWDIKHIQEASTQEPILYTNPFGEFDKFDFKLIYTPSIPFVNETIEYNISDVEGRAEYEAFNTIIKYISSYPLVKGINIDETSILNIDNVNYLKDMLDTFNWTFAIRYESDIKIIYCRNFFKNSILMTSNGAEIKEVRTYNKNMTENDFKTEQAVETSLITNSSLLNDEITITLDDELQPAKCIALVDENNEPLLIINDFDKIKSENFDSIKLYC